MKKLKTLMKTHLTKKQLKIAVEYFILKPMILVLYGAVRSGKTYLAIVLFISFVRANKGKKFSFILGGVDGGTIKRNILEPMENILGVSIILDRYNSFKLFGNTVYCFGGDDKRRWKRVRGFTAKGALINEATALDESFIMEIVSRCSEYDSRIIMDTNPDNPMHFVKKNFIDKSGSHLPSGRINVTAHHFSIYDNELLSDDYINGLIASTPSGVQTDRNIHGRWVAAQGIIYRDFNENNLISVEAMDRIIMSRVFCGVDWGWSHKGVIAVWGYHDGKYYRLEEHVERFKDVDDYWVGIGLDIQRRYNQYGSIPFYYDPARPEYGNKFIRSGLNAQPAFNAVMPGITVMASLYKRNLILIPDDPELNENYMEEIYVYTYATSGKDEPMKINDDCMDADRYAVATDYEATARAEQSIDDKLKMLHRYGL